MADIEQASARIHLLAGQKPGGQFIYEEVFAKNVGDNCYQLTTSPVFARGAAKLDIIRLQSAGYFEVEQYNGNLCVRILAKTEIDVIRQRLDLSFAALGAELDYQNDRMLVYSVPVKAGFEAIEKVLNEAMQNISAQCYMRMFMIH